MQSLFRKTFADRKLKIDGKLMSNSHIFIICYLVLNLAILMVLPTLQKNVTKVIAHRKSGDIELSGDAVLTTWIATCKALNFSNTIG